MTRLIALALLATTSMTGTALARSTFESVFVVDPDKEVMRWIAAQPGGEAIIRQTIEAMPTAETFPVVANLVADVREGVWAEIYAMPGDSIETWLHLTEEGVQCRVDLPRAFTMLEAASDWILGSITDELGVQTVQLWDVRR